MEVVGQIPSVASGELARVYRLKPLQEVQLARLHPSGSAVTFSVYAKTLAGSDKLRLSLRSPLCTQTKDFVITHDRWTRCILSVRNSIDLNPLEVLLSSRIALRDSVDVGLAFPQIEEAAFATSPIPPDCQLPVGEIPKGKQGARRDQDLVWLDEKKNGLAIDSASATVLFVGQPQPKTDEIIEGTFISFISFWSSAANTEITFGISGSHQARFVVRERRNGRDSITLSEVFGGHQTYFLCVVFDRNALTFIVNGQILVTHSLSETLSFDRTYLGGTHEPGAGSFNGYVQRYAMFATPLVYPRILEMYQELCPEAPQHTYDYMLRYFRYALTTDSELTTVRECLADEGFSYFVSQLQFAVPIIFEQFPPQRHFTEEEVRDWIYALMLGPGLRSSRESYTKVGRTDVALNYKIRSDEKEIEKTYRIELKIWGREGYKDAPSQPIKYMAEDDRAGAFIMIDRRANPQFEDFVEIVRTNSDFPCLSIREVALVDTDIKYFLSFHTDPRYRTPRMMINLFLPIGDQTSKAAGIS